MNVIFVKNFIEVSAKNILLIAEAALKKKISKNLLISSSNQIISDFVKKKNLFDYFKTSDLTNYFLKIDIIFFVKEKINVQIIDNFNEIKKTEEKKTTKKQKIKSKYVDSDLQFDHKQNNEKL